MNKDTEPELPPYPGYWEAAPDKKELLMESMAVDLTHISAAMLSLAGIAHVDVDPTTGGIRVRPLTPEEREAQGNPLPPQRMMPGQTKVHPGGSSIAWEIVPPPPYTGVVIVCVPDDTTPVGMRCYAEAKLVGGQRKKWDVTWTERS